MQKDAAKERRCRTALNAWQLIAGGDPTLFAIVRLSLMVSLSAVAIAALVGMPLGALLALTRFPGRNVVIVILNAFMGLPPVVVGLAVYLLLSRSGPLGASASCSRRTAMVIAQAILILPIIAALSRQTIEDLWARVSRRTDGHGRRPGRRASRRCCGMRASVCSPCCWPASAAPPPKSAR